MVSPEFLVQSDRTACQDLLVLQDQADQPDRQDLLVNRAGQDL